MERFGKEPAGFGDGIANACRALQLGCTGWKEYLRYITPGGCPLVIWGLKAEHLVGEAAAMYYEGSL